MYGWSCTAEDPLAELRPEVEELKTEIEELKKLLGMLGKRVCPYLTPRQPCPTPQLEDCYIHTDWGLVPCPVLSIAKMMGHDRGDRANTGKLLDLYAQYQQEANE